MANCWLCSDEIIAGLCLVARPMMAIKSQEIMSEGLPGREMFMLLAGEVEVSAPGLIYFIGPCYSFN